MTAKQPHPIQTYRERRGLSRKELGDELSVSEITVWRWENGRRKPNRNLLPKLKELTGIPVEQLMGMS